MFSKVFQGREPVTDLRSAASPDLSPKRLGHLGPALRSARVRVLGYIVRILATLPVKRAVRKQRQRAVLVGAYGNGNYGDDAIGIAICHELDRVGYQVIVVGRMPEGARVATEGRASFVFAGSGLTSIFRTWRVARGASVAILGGGGLFEGDLAVVHTRRLLLEYAGKLAACRVRGARIFIHGLGVAPEALATPVVAPAIKSVLRACSGVSVRDRKSHQAVLRAFPDAILARDPALPLLQAWAADTQESADTVGVVVLDRNRWPSFVDPGQPEPERDALIERLVTLVLAQSRSVVELHPFHSSDPQLLADLASALRKKGIDSHLRPYPNESAEAAFKDLMHCEAVVTMRFHPALASMAARSDVAVEGHLQKLDELRSTFAESSQIYPGDFEDPQAVLSGWLDSHNTLLLKDH